MATPYDDLRPKGEQVEEMFDSIAPAYDLMNTAMTFGLHRRWRNRALAKVRRMRSGLATDRILDIATGTGDVAFRLADMFPEARIKGVDLSEGMLGIARKKAEKLDGHVHSRLSFEQGDSLALALPDGWADLVTVAYGVRNFERLESGIKEMARVLAPGGTLCIIELSRPTGALTRPLYDFYSRNVIPTAGRLVSGDSRAYSYLPESIAAAPQRDALAAIMRRAGLTGCRWEELTFGSVCIYFGTKGIQDIKETE